MTVVDVLGIRGRGDNDAVGFRHGDGGLGSELVFLVLFAFGDAVDLRFVEGIDLVAVASLLPEHTMIKREVLRLALLFIFRKFEFELAHKPAFLHSIELFHGHADVGQILLAVHPDRLDDFAFRWADAPATAVHGTTS